MRVTTLTFIFIFVRNLFIAREFTTGSISHLSLPHPIMTPTLSCTEDTEISLSLLLFGCVGYGWANYGEGGGGVIKHRHYSDTDIMLSSRYFPKGGLLDDDVMLPSCCTSSLLVVNWIAGWLVSMYWLRKCLRALRILRRTMMVVGPNPKGVVNINSPHCIVINWQTCSCGWERGYVPWRNCNWME